MLNEKIRIKLKSFNYQLLDQSAIKIVELVTLLNCAISGPIPLPMKKRIYCLLRSPHVNKDSREHFEIRVYKRVIDIYYPNHISMIEVLGEIDLPAGVLYQIKVIKKK